MNQGPNDTLNRCSSCLVLLSPVAIRLAGLPAILSAAVDEHDEGFVAEC